MLIGLLQNALSAFGVNVAVDCAAGLEARLTLGCSKALSRHAILGDL